MEDRKNMLTVNQSEKDCCRILWIDLLKGIGIILVVVGHVYHNSIIYDWIYSFHMPLFFFAAGFLYRKQGIILYIKRRIVTLVVPYFSFGILGFIYWAVIERRMRETTISIFDSFIGLFRGQPDYNIPLWFLPCLFLVGIIYNILMNINNRMTYITVILISIFCVMIPLPPLPWGLDKVCRYTSFYAAGDVASELYLKKYPLRNNLPQIAQHSFLGGGR